LDNGNDISDALYLLNRLQILITLILRYIYEHDMTDFAMDETC